MNQTPTSAAPPASTPPHGHPVREVLREARATARTMAGAVLLALFLRAFVVQAYEIPSGSMIPTLEVGDRVFVSKLAYGARLPFAEQSLVRWAKPARGEVVVFSDPVQGKDLIKRVIALAGDRVEVRNDVVLVNGRAVPRTALGECRYEDRPGEGAAEAPPAGEPAGAAAAAENGWSTLPCVAFQEQLGQTSYRTIVAPRHAAQYSLPTEVPPGHVFVLGDHRDNSADSRFYGPVPVDRLRGRALAVFWSRGAQMRWARLGHPVR